MNKLAKLIEEKRSSQGREVDMLNCLLKEDNNYKLDDEEIIDLIITLLYSGYETVSTTSMMAIKYLHDHPHVLDELRVSSYFLKYPSFFFLNFLDKIMYYLVNIYFLHFDILVPDCDMCGIILLLVTSIMEWRKLFVIFNVTPS